MSDDTTDDLPSDKPLHEAVGRAISEYAQVEFTLASILQNLLRISFRDAHCVLFAIQNTRSRNELFQILLEDRFTTAIRKHWATCQKFLQTLATYRNAIAHWHASATLHLLLDDKARSEWRLSHPVPGYGPSSVGLEQLGLFMADCKAIRTDLSSLVAIAKERPDTLPEKFRRPITHQNQAVLRQRRKPKESQPQRPPSRQSVQKGKKSSSAQRRKEALARAKRRSEHTRP